MSQYKKISLLVFLLSFPLAAQQPNAAELQLAVNRLGVTGSVLYIAAHPDDENTALLAYFAKERLYRTGYLSITRGEGGQNLVGSEQGAALGVIRTQELLAARRVDGAEQFFTRAIDFGYSKSAEEALRLWNKDSVLKDVVWIIRTFRPDVIITRFTPTLGGHGQHLASAILAEEAFRISGDPSVYPDQLTAVAPWKAKRLLFNHFSFGGTNSNPDNKPTVKIDVGEYNALLGKSYTELAGISRTMHKSQAMGSSQPKGSAINEFSVTAGEAVTKDLFDGVDAQWTHLPAGKKVKGLTDEVRSKFSAEHPERSIPALLKLRAALRPLAGDPVADRKLRETEETIRGCAGLSVEASAAEPVYSRGDSVRGTVTYLVRTPANVSVLSLTSTELGMVNASRQPLKRNEPFTVPVAAAIRPQERYSQPYWLSAPANGFLYSVPERTMIGRAENPPVLYINTSVMVEKDTIEIAVPVRYKWVDDLQGEKTRAVEVIPPVSLRFTEPNELWSMNTSKSVPVCVHPFKSGVAGTVRLRAPKGWMVSEEQTITATKKDAETELRFTVTPDSTAAAGPVIAEAVVGADTIRSTVLHIDHDHIPVQPMMTPAEGKLLPLDLKTKGRRIGYIMGAGDEVPAALRQMGYEVTMLTDADLLSGDCSRFDAVVAGVRAYNTREQLRLCHSRLIQYAENGGTYVVQYQVLEKGKTDNIGPFPLTVSRNRVTDETAAPVFVTPDDPILTTPNRITAKDFDGWVQERGLYFASDFDPRYRTPLAFADPNEAPQKGGLLIATVGKGTVVVTGLAFFRQLPAGVPGAYRLFANLLSAGK